MKIYIAVEDCRESDFVVYGENYDKRIPALDHEIYYTKEGVCKMLLNRIILVDGDLPMDLIQPLIDEARYADAYDALVERCGAWIYCPYYVEREIEGWKK